MNRIAREVKGATIAGLARARQADIERAAEAVKPAESGRIHTFIATSDIHLQYKLRMSRDQVYEAAMDAVKYARKFTDDVEFSAEDATRSDWDFLCRITEGAINAGASTINIPDTVGYTVPQEFEELIAYLFNTFRISTRRRYRFIVITILVSRFQTRLQRFSMAPGRWSVR